MRFFYRKKQKLFKLQSLRRGNPVCKVAFALFIFLSKVGIAADYLLPTPQVETLSNGLKLVWFVDSSLPVVDLSLLVQAGFKDDLPGKSGTCELMTAALDRGSGGKSAKEVAFAIEKLGASRTNHADEDSLSLGLHGLALDANSLLELLGQIALKPNFDPKEISREKEKIRDRWNHLPDYSEALASLAYHRIQAANTVYGRGSLLTLGEFQKLNVSDVKEFHERNFNPKNMTLMVVGRVNTEDFKKRIEDTFGKWKSKAPLTLRNQNIEKKVAYQKYTDPRLVTFSRQRNVIVVDRPGLNQAQIKIGFRAPLIHSPDHFPMVVANSLLGEYFQSRLNQELRDRLGYTYAVQSSLLFSKDLAELTISSATRNETVSDFILKTLEVLKEIKSGKLSEEEVSQSKKYLEGSFPVRTSTLGAVAARWLAADFFGLGPQYLNQYTDRIRNVTYVQVKESVKKNFRVEEAVIVIAGDFNEIQKANEKASKKLPPFKRIRPDDLM